MAGRARGGQGVFGSRALTGDEEDAFPDPFPHGAAVDSCGLTWSKSEACETGVVLPLLRVLGVEGASEGFADRLIGGPSTSMGPY